MDSALRAAVDQITTNLPCSVALPAGAGKTHLIAAITASLAAAGKRSLILTHTHAGVYALRKRVRAFDVPHTHVSIRTIDGWSFDLIRHFPQLAEIAVPDEPDWRQAPQYHLAAAHAATTDAVRRMLRVSYDVILVDEYQDCLVDQHTLVLALSAVVPTAVVGDPLQGLFDFGSNTPVAWETDVLPSFPAQTLSVVPWRWQDGNPALGQWLLEIRGRLTQGQSINLADAPVAWRQASDPRAASQACLAHTTADGSVVALGSFRADVAKLAQQLNGSYGVMEELEGKTLVQFAQIVDTGSGPRVARATVEFAVACAVGVAAAFSSAARKNLGEGKSVSTRKEGRKAQFDAVNRVSADPSPENVRLALMSLGQLEGFSLHCREAWDGVVTALRHSSLDPSLTVRAAVVRMRNHTRIVGRRAERRAVSRPLLVKGLEYDHAILIDADRYTAQELYVALTRGKRSVTVISRSRTITPVQR